MTWAARCINLLRNRSLLDWKWAASQKKRVAALGDKDYGIRLFNKAKDMLDGGTDLVKLAGMVREALDDKELALEIYKKAGGCFTTYNDMMGLAGAVLKGHW